MAGRVLHYLVSRTGAAKGLHMGLCMEDSNCPGSPDHTKDPAKVTCSACRNHPEFPR